jgi:hypothetical protein
MHTSARLHKVNLSSENVVAHLPMRSHLRFTIPNRFVINDESKGAYGNTGI